MSILINLLFQQIISRQSKKCSTGNLIISENIDFIPVGEYENCNEYTGELIIPENINLIKQRAFYGCTGLSGDLIIPDSVKEIETEAFYGCTGFTSLKLGKKLNAIRRSAFENCVGMKGQLTIYENIKMIDSYAFQETNFNEIVFEYAFIGCGVGVFPPQVHGVPPKNINYEIPRNLICGVPVEIPSKPKSKAWIWIVVVIVIVLLVALFFVLKKYCDFSCGCIYDYISNCCCPNDSEAEDLESIPRRRASRNKKYSNDDDGYSEDSDPIEDIEKVFYFTKIKEEKQDNTDDEIDEYYSDDNVAKRRKKASENIANIETFGVEENEEIILYAPISLDDEHVVQLQNGQKMINLGKRNVIHATTYEAAQNILKENSLRLGKSGMFGAGIYFAANKKIARHKCTIARGTVAAYVSCVVDFGNALILNRPNKTMCLNDLEKLGCNSVMGRSKEGRDWEFVVYERSRTNPIELILLKQRMI